MFLSLEIIYKFKKINLSISWIPKQTLSFTTISQPALQMLSNFRPPPISPPNFNIPTHLNVANTKFI